MDTSAKSPGPKKSPSRRDRPRSHLEPADVIPQVEDLLAGYLNHSVTLQAQVMELNWRLATTEAARAAFFVQRLRSLGLPSVPAQYNVLRDLYFSEDGCLSQSQIMRNRGVNSGNVTRLIHRMERTGLVRRDVHPRDKRSTVVHLTAAGYSLCEQVVPVIAKDQNALSSCFDDTELELLNRLLARFHFHVEEMASKIDKSD